MAGQAPAKADGRGARSRADLIMKFIDEYRGGEQAAQFARAMARRVTRPWTVMEVCGGQTHAIVKFGVDELLPKGVELVHGPGCPVCVTPLELIDKAIEVASRAGVVFCSFGDMLRVPGSRGDLFSVKAAGGDVPDNAFLGRLRLRLTDGREIRPLVAALRRPKDWVVVEFTPGTPRDSVAGMRGAEVLWEADEEAIALLGRLEADALLGMRLVGPGAAGLGEVVGVLQTPVHAVLEVAGADGRGLLLPMVREVVERIDWESGVILVGDIAPFAVDDAH